MRGAVAASEANQAGTLAVLGCACVCDRCGQERSSRFGKEGSRQIQATQNRRKKLLRPLPDSARVGFSHRCSCSFSFWKARFGGFSFLGHRDSFSCYRRTGQNRKGPDRVCPNICDAASAMQLKSVFPSYTTMTKEPRGPAISVADRNTQIGDSHRFYSSNEQFLLYAIKRLKTSEKIKLLQEILAVTGQGNGRGHEELGFFYSCLYDTGQLLPVFLQGLLVQIAQGLDYPVFKGFLSLS
jgi:hypothetical protein